MNRQKLYGLAREFRTEVKEEYIKTKNELTQLYRDAEKMENDRNSALPMMGYLLIVPIFMASVPITALLNMRFKIRLNLEGNLK